jgi:hypothetical protein
MSAKFPIQVYKYIGRGKMETSKWYDLTLEELESGKYCIFACAIYFKDSIPKELWGEIELNWVELRDIWNYECVAWWKWPQELKEIMYAKVPKSRPECDLCEKSAEKTIKVGGTESHFCQNCFNAVEAGV